MATRDHLTALPNALHNILATREITENDYDILLQLEKFILIPRKENRWKNIVFSL